MKIRDIILAERTWQKPSAEFIKCLEIYIESSAMRDLPKKTQTRIDRAFQAKMQKIEESHIVYRGTNFPDWNYVPKYLDFHDKQGGVLKFPDYTSTSTDYNVAYGFIRGDRHVNADGLYMMFEIDTKPGIRAIDVYKFLNLLDLEEPELAENEWEIILNKGAEFNIISTEKMPGGPKEHPGSEYWKVKLEQIK